MAAEANKSEARRCIDIAHERIANNDWEGALKILKKSIKLHETSDAKKLLEKVESRLNNNNNNNNNTNNDNDNDEKFSRSASFRSTSSSSSSTSTSSSYENDTSSRSRREEEVEIIKKILRAKDYYDIFSVDKNNFDENQLKKSYKTLALKVHPDRNKAPGAEEAFKKLSAAYECLRKPEKRSLYNQYGTETPQMRSQFQHEFQQMTPDDIIRMFFGGDFSFGGEFGAHHRRHSQRRSDHHSTSGSGFALLQFLPLLLMLLSMIMPSFIMNRSSTNNYTTPSWEGQYYSMDYHPPFINEQKTSQTDIKYYMRQGDSYRFGHRYKDSIESQVEASYLNKLIDECDKEKSHKKNTINDIKKSKNSRERINLLKKVEKNNNKCGQLNDFINQL